MRGRTEADNGAGPVQTVTVTCRSADRVAVREDRHKAAGRKGLLEEKKLNSTGAHQKGEVNAEFCVVAEERSQASGVGRTQSRTRSVLLGLG